MKSKIVNFKKPEEKPLSEILNERKEYYTGKVAQALMTYTEKIAQIFDKVYKSRNLDYINKFEQAILTLTKKVINSGLESIVTETEKKPVKKEIIPREKTDKRPRLTLYQYTKAREEGMTNEQIKEKFRMDSNYQIGGYARQYYARKEKDIKGLHPYTPA